MSMMPDAKLRVALAHDWLTGMRGGERVLETLCRMFPSAPIYTLIYAPERVSDVIRRHPVHVSFLRRIPGIVRWYRWFLPVFPAAVKRMRLAPADLVISTSHCAAKNVIPPPGARHLCYCFTPMRYAWVFYGEYFGANPLKRMLLRPVLAYLRRWDRRACARVDRFVTLSQHVRKRILRFYGRNADVVYPPVNTDYWTPAPDADAQKGDYDLVVSALVPYKRLDLAVRAYARSGRRLKIIGAGTEYRSLHELAGAGANIEFLGRLPDVEVREAYRGCRALIFPGEEDFGLVPVEAQACGKPVVAYARGGVSETVVDGVTGVFFSEQTVNSLQAAVARCDGMAWDAAAIRRHAEQFCERRFMDGIRAGIQDCLADVLNDGLSCEIKA